MNLLEKYSQMDPGKYWKLPQNKKHLIDTYLISEDYFPMVKMDGYWSRVIIYDRKVLIQSRGISTVTKTYGDYTPLVPHIVEELLARFPDNTVLLGELCFSELNRTATEVGTILRSLPAKAIARQKDEKNKIHLFIFDILVFDGVELIDKSFEERFLPRYVLPNPQFSKYVSVPMTSKSSEAKEMLEYVWSKGGEGIILINKKMPYNIGGAKAWHSIKVKRELGDLEGKVIGLIEPNRLYEGDDVDNWEYWESDVEGKFTREKLINMTLIQGKYYPVTKPHYFGRKVGVVVEYQGRKINITSGTTEEDGEYLASPEARKRIDDGKLYASFTGMELTAESVRHPRLLRLRDDI